VTASRILVYCRAGFEKECAQELAAARGIPAQSLGDITSANAARFFGLPLTVDTRTPDARDS